MYIIFRNFIHLYAAFSLLSFGVVPDRTNTQDDDRHIATYEDNSGDMSIMTWNVPKTRRNQRENEFKREKQTPNFVWVVFDNMTITCVIDRAPYITDSHVEKSELLD